MEDTASRIASIFNHIADLLEIQGANVFRIRAYRKAAAVVEAHSGDIEDLAQQDRLTSLEGIGKDLSEKIKEIIATGTLADYRKIKERIPEGVAAMMNVSSIGPKKAKLFYEALGITGIPELEKAIGAGKLLGVPGVKAKTIANIQKGIALLNEGADLFGYLDAVDTARRYCSFLNGYAADLAVAGSLRRRKVFVRDIDILAASGNAERLMDRFVGYGEVKHVLAHGPTKSSVLLRNAMQVDLRRVAKESWGAALVYFTGSKDFNIKLRSRALEMGCKINEYGIFKEGRKQGGKTEEEMFGLLGLSYLPPELREDRGEIEAALQKRAFPLVGLEQIRGEFHVHSRYSDGMSDIPAIAQAAQKRGYEYVGIADHSETLKVAHGLDRRRLKQKIREIRSLNARLKDIRLLCCQEVDILDDGSLDCPVDLLEELDVVIGALHIGLKQPQEKITRRLVTACKNKYVHIIAHPTGILKGVRDAYAVDLKELFKAARDYRVALEINAYPDRLDLDEVHARAAHEAGVRLAVNTDTHTLEHLAYIELGINVARRAWLDASDIVNTMPYRDVMKWSRQKK